MKNVIITGGTGFIGSWLAKELEKNGIEVTLIVRDKSKIPPDYGERQSIHVVEGRIEEVADILNNREHFDCFYHLAWDGVASDKKNDIETQLGNIHLAVSALELCNRLKCDRFIAAGTVAEYVFSKDIMDFSLPQTPNDMYGAAKTATHYFLQVRARQLNQGYNWVIIPSTFGEGRKDNNIITYTIRSLIKGEKPSYGNLTQMWDFLYVAEVTRALRLIGERGKKDTIYGIGSGIYRPLRDYIEIVRNLIDPGLPLGIGEREDMSEQTFSSCVNTLNLIRDTGYIPEITFEEGIKRTIEYWRVRG